MPLRGTLTDKTDGLQSFMGKGPFVRCPKYTVFESRMARFSRPTGRPAAIFREIRHPEPDYSAWTSVSFVKPRSLIVGG